MVVMRLLWLPVVAFALLASATPAATEPALDSVGFLESMQHQDGGFAEVGRRPDASLTAWAALALVAGGAREPARNGALAYLRAHEGETRAGTDLALHVLARAALGDRPAGLTERLRGHRPDVLINETIWTILALRGLGEPVPRQFVSAVLKAQHPSGGWSWARRGTPDSNDTAAAIQALRSVGVTGKPIKRALAALRAFGNKDGGFALTSGRASDAQSTAWAVQAFLAAGVKPGKPPFRYLSRLRRGDASYRYTARYPTTPVWVTSQVVPALAGRPFPLTTG